MLRCGLVKGNLDGALLLEGCVLFFTCQQVMFKDDKHTMRTTRSSYGAQELRPAGSHLGRRGGSPIMVASWVSLSHPLVLD